MAEWEAALPKLKAAYKAWHDSKGSSIDVWLDLMADGVDFRSLANGAHGIPWTKRRSSRADVHGYLADLTSGFQMEHYTVERYICQDDTIVMIGITAWHSKTTGKRAETPKVAVWRFKDGKAVSYFEYFDTAMVSACAAC